MKSRQIPVCLVMLSLVAYAAACSKRSPPPTVTSTAVIPQSANHNVKDGDITQAIEQGFSRDPGIDGKAIQVKTTGGIVELTGTTDNLLTDRRATRLAETVKGVRSVSDRIQITPKERPDADIQRDVSHALEYNADTDSFQIGVAAKKGAVTLTGTVHSRQEQKLAERMAEGVRGVTSVDNQIGISYGAPRSDSEIRADIQSQFRWDRLLNDGLLEVAVSGGRVTLTGVVGSAAERRRAERAAWVNGVKSMSDSQVRVEWWAKEQDLLRTKLARKTDGEIAKAIRDAAALDPRVQTAGLLVDVSMGIANLRGTVESVHAKNAAESLARNTVGVLDVNDELKVEPHKAVSDKTIAKHVRDALAYGPALGSFHLDANSKDGTVTLTGKVESSFERAEAADVAAGIRGVRRIDNQVGLERAEVAYVYSWFLDPYEPFIETWHYAPPKPLQSDAEIKQQIKLDLAFSPFVDANQVKVAVNGGTATLTGAVDSYGERAAATEDAFEGGAIAVENRLQVAPPGG